jgi:predicted nucleic acid-binding protein
MIILDTNVLSEVMKETPHAAVKRWMVAQVAARLVTTAVCEAEMLYGIAILPAGRRRTALHGAAEKIFGEFADRILPFDSVAARAFADIAAARRRAGRPIGESDAQIAAIARSYGAAVATRDVDDFAGCGVRVVSPWTES